MNATQWPELPYSDWVDTCDALHLWCQIVGKYRLANTPWLNHSWHATLYVTPRGLTTGPVFEATRTVAVLLDLREHRLVAEDSNGRSAGFELAAMPVAEFLARTRAAVVEVGEV